ncbi:MAG: ParB/RepB/Spo0J family partition protein [Oscillospiraceae bacterium]|jgi:ParB family chromosome partitioning protein|nr:ParB/RepB/Spo0J family partition protein [Oscillospiraceae bacterium]
MKTVGNLALAGFSDIFGTSDVGADGERVAEIALAELFPPDFHPFQVNDDDAMERLVRSVAQYGVREPGLARPRDGGGYELLCGNRRRRACELAGIAAMPVIVRDMDDDTAAIAMVDSNLEQREKLLFSERAWAYRVKMEALNHSGVRAEMNSVEVLVAQTGESKTQIFRLIRLTELVPALLDLADAKKFAFNPAVELSYLTRTEQTSVAEYMAQQDMRPSLSQAQQLKKASQDGVFTRHKLESVMTKPPTRTDIDRIDPARFKRYFPDNYTPRQMESVIERLLREWQAAQEE